MSSCDMGLYSSVQTVISLTHYLINWLSNYIIISITLFTLIWVVTSSIPHITRGLSCFLLVIDQWPGICLFPLPADLSSFPQNITPLPSFPDIITDLILWSGLSQSGNYRERRNFAGSMWAEWTMGNIRGVESNYYLLLFFITHYKYY